MIVLVLSVSSKLERCVHTSESSPGSRRLYGRDIPDPHTLNPNTLNPHTLTLNPKPLTLNPKTLNP